MKIVIMKEGGGRRDRREGREGVIKIREEEKEIWILKMLIWAFFPSKIKVHLHARFPSQFYDFGYWNRTGLLKSDEEVGRVNSS